MLSFLPTLDEFCRISVLSNLAMQSPEVLLVKDKCLVRYQRARFWLACRRIMGQCYLPVIWWIVHEECAWRASEIAPEIFLSEQATASCHIKIMPGIAFGIEGSFPSNWHHHPDSNSCWQEKSKTFYFLTKHKTGPKPLGTSGGTPKAASSI